MSVSKGRFPQADMVDTQTRHEGGPSFRTAGRLFQGSLRFECSNLSGNLLNCHWIVPSRSLGALPSYRAGNEGTQLHGLSDFGISAEHGVDAKCDGHNLPPEKFSI